MGVWPKSQGLNDRTGIITASVTSGTASIADLDPNTDYYIASDGVGAYRQTGEFNTGDFGSAPAAIELQQIIQANGASILPATLTADQRRIANMFIYSVADGRVDIKLPDDYASDDRWNEGNKIWRFTNEDFVAIAYRVEELQSSAAFLAINATILIEQFKMTLKAASTFIMRQHTDNVECVINMTAFTIVREGDDGQDKTYLDHANGVINTNAGSPVVATLSTPANVLEAMANQIPDKVNEATNIQTILDNTASPVSLPENLTAVVDSLAVMINATNQFTANALANGPTADLGSANVTIDTSNIAQNVWEYATRTLSEAPSTLTADDVINAILDAPYNGKKPDGTPLGIGTLGEHLWQFYPPEIIKQLLETALDGTTQATRFNPCQAVMGLELLVMPCERYLTAPRLKMLD